MYITPDVTPVLQNCTFTSNSANSGGAVYVAASAGASITNCTFTSNTASAGGAIDADNSITVNSTSFTRNTATAGNGGALLINRPYPGGTTNLFACTFYGNTSSANGGAVYIAFHANSINCAFVGNSSTNGGAIYLDTYGMLSISANTFVDNSASSIGGVAFFANSTTFSLYNSIIWSNAAHFLPVIAGGSGAIKYTDCQFLFIDTGDIKSDPAFIRSPSPGPDAAWGTSDDDYGDLRLLPSSPCIDTGSFSLLPPGTSNDFIGYDCAINDRVVGITVDMGAYEFIPQPTWIATSSLANYSFTNLYSSSPLLTVNSATVTLNADASLTYPNISLLANATTLLNSRQHFAYLSASNSSVSVSSSGTKSLIVNSLSLTNGSFLDLSDNALIITQDDSTTLTSLHSYLQSGRAGSPGSPGAWNGPGIQSSYAKQFGNGFNLAIGYADNTDLAAVRTSGSYTTFAGQTVASNYVLVQLTRGADATLDGILDGQDVAVIGTHFQKPGSGQWCFGDFDYSGTCDGSDVSVLGTTFGKTSPLLSPAHFSTSFNSLTPDAAPTGTSTSTSTSASSSSIANPPIPVNDSTSKSHFSSMPIVNRSTGETDVPLYKTKRRGLASRPEPDLLSRQS